ncbi:uncharacterized protein LOC135847742 isoform X2 [Planococcus citri]
MEVQQRQELEVIEVTSEVYDILHPTPVSLKQLSAIATSREIWRSKVNEYRTGRKLENFNPCRLHRETTWMKTMLPDLPSTIYETIEEVVSRFGHSMEAWLTQHYQTGFRFQYTDENHVLEDFDNFSCDYDGSIHYVRTAERMMHCEGFNLETKFIVACMYFFEDDIRRIWPSVSRKMNLDLIDFYYYPQCYYWICRLSNKLDKIRTWGGQSVDERMFGRFMSCNRPSVEYFWNRLPLEKRMQAIDALGYYEFVRFILPKLNDEQLDKYVNDEDGDRLYGMFLNLHCDEWGILRTWLHIRNIIKESNFTNLIIRMFLVEDGEGEYHQQEKWKYLCCQIWNHTPLNLKQSMISVISSDNSWFEGTNINYGHYEFDEMNVELLLAILQDASLNERHSFWRNCWSDLIEPVRSKNLQRVMESIFENEDEINQFKQNVMISSEVVLELCGSLFRKKYFVELNAFVSFCCPEPQAANNFREQILQSVFLGEDCYLRSAIVCEIEKFTELVKDVSADFKNRLISSPIFMERLSNIICAGLISSKTIIKFIDNTLVSTEETVMQVKMSLIDSLKEYLTGNSWNSGDIFRKNVFNSVLFWCLGSNEEVEKFKLNCTSL